MAGSSDVHKHLLTHTKEIMDTNKNMATTAGIYHSGLFVFMSPLPRLSPLLNCVLTLWVDNAPRLWPRRKVIGSVPPSGTFEGCVVESSVSGLASHATNDSFMTPVPSLRDHKATKQHATLNKETAFSQCDLVVIYHLQ
ncbi:hypothetical protein ATANTOWER_007701 [Ataeniobius toweri]|uniref:Uncharacterized protein n=1 Tax=Ataeniobius toweri TaxID=208326 RepID=A0ABU7A5Q3_9TELE|nr:hypothetical protein [Ataeniobius toweri]